MINRTFFAASFFAACLIAALAACERPQQTPATKQVPVAPATVERHTVSVAPEHFDRMRAEQFEKEEDRLRRRGNR
jgi:hypothetical protein